MSLLATRIKRVTLAAVDEKEASMNGAPTEAMWEVDVLPSSDPFFADNPSPSPAADLFELTPMINAKASQWVQQFEGLDALRVLALHHADVLSEKALNEVLPAVCRCARELRSTVSRNALACLADIYAHCGDRATAQLSLTLGTCLEMSGASAKFIRVDASKALKAATDNKSICRLSPPEFAKHAGSTNRECQKHALEHLDVALQVLGVGKHGGGGGADAERPKPAALAKLIEPLAVGLRGKAAEGKAGSKRALARISKELGDEAFEGTVRKALAGRDSDVAAVLLAGTGKKATKKTYSKFKPPKKKKTTTEDAATQEEAKKGGDPKPHAPNKAKKSSLVPAANKESPAKKAKPAAFGGDPTAKKKTAAAAVASTPLTAELHEKLVARMAAQKTRPAEIFKEADTDRNSVLDVDELKTIFNKVGLKCSAAETKAIFAAIDTNADGHLQYGEVTKFLKKFQDEGAKRRGAAAVAASGKGSGAKAKKGAATKKEPSSAASPKKKNKPAAASSASPTGKKGGYTAVSVEDDDLSSRKGGRAASTTSKKGLGVISAMAAVAFVVAGFVVASTIGGGGGGGGDEAAGRGSGGGGSGKQQVASAVVGTTDATSSYPH